MEAQALVSQMKQNLVKIQIKEFEKLPTVKRFSERVKVVDRKYVFHDVVLTHFEKGMDAEKTQKMFGLSSYRKQCRVGS